MDWLRRGRLVGHVMLRWYHQVGLLQRSQKRTLQSSLFSPYEFFDEKLRRGSMERKYGVRAESESNC